VDTHALEGIETDLLGDLPLQNFLPAAEAEIPWKGLKPYSVARCGVTVAPQKRRFPGRD
jgi:hypothetical protein